MKQLELIIVFFITASTGYGAADDRLMSILKVHNQALFAEVSESCDTFLRRVVLPSEKPACIFTRFLDKWTDEVFDDRKIATLSLPELRRAQATLNAITDHISSPLYAYHSTKPLHIVSDRAALRRLKQA